MSRRIEILVVGESPCDAARSLLDNEAFDGRVRAPTDAISPFELSPPDCLVACTPSLPTALAAAAAEAGCPIVDCDHGATSEPDAPPLSARVRSAVGETPNRQRIARLHAGSTELIGIEDHDRLYQRIVDIGTGVLGFGIAVLYLREDDGFRLGASTDPTSPERAPPGFGLLSHVSETGESVIVDDIAAHPIAEQRTDEHRSGVAVPFGDVGVLGGLSTERGAYDEADLEFAQLLANHGAQVDARIRAEQRLQERQVRVTRLHEAAPTLIDADNEAALFGRIVDIAQNVLELDQSVLFVDRDGELTAVTGRIDRLPEVSPEAGILERTYTEQRSFLIDDAQTHSDATPVTDWIRSAISVPVGDDAVFQAFSEEAGALDEGDLELAELLVGYVAATRERLRSEAALRESRRVIERLHDTAMSLGTADSESALLDRGVAAAEDVLDLDMCKIDVLEGEMLVPAAESDDVPPGAAQSMHISEGVAGKTARTGESFRIDDVAADPDADPTAPGFSSAISVPIGDLGVFQAVSTEPAAFDQDDLDLAELLMAHVAVSLRRVRAEADLRRERDSLDALFENIPGAAVAYEIVDGEPIIDRVNGAFEATFGYDAETVVGDPLDDYVVPPGAEADAAAYNRRLANGERVQAEVERQTADGMRHFLMQVSPISVGEADAPGYVIYSDVTEQREREAELRRQNERLDQFASVVSHDLRNPINVASGYVDLARETGDVEQLDHVADAIERMDALVTDLLTLAREGSDVGETRPVDLDTVAREAWSHVATDDASLAVETDREVEADRDRLTELFENLYRNAVEHSSTGNRKPGVSGDAVEHSSTGNQKPAASGDAVEHAGDAPTVTVDDLPDAEGFFVADDGPGIDPEIDAFEPGVTTSDEGTGFGLAIVESIAEAHGWSVSATESEAGGARFEFTFG